MAIKRDDLSRLPGWARAKVNEQLSDQRKSESAPKSFEVVLPWPPSMNHYWRHVGPRVLVSREGREYRKLVDAKCCGAPLLPGLLRVVVGVSPPDKRRRDLDNLEKPLYDALQHAGVYADDYMINDRRIYRQRDTSILAPGMVHVYIEVIEKKVVR